MNDCTTNHAHLIKLEGELHPSGKDYYCTDCGDVFEVEVKPATIGVVYGEPGDTNQPFELSTLNYDPAMARTHLMVPKDMKCHKCGADEPWKDPLRKQVADTLDAISRAQQPQGETKP